MEIAAKPIVIEQIKVVKALEISRQAVGHGNRSTFYEWLRLLRIRPIRGTVTRYELARVCVFGKAVAATGDKKAAIKEMLDYAQSVSREEFYEFAFNPNQIFRDTGVRNAS